MWHDESIDRSVCLLLLTPMIRSSKYIVAVAVICKTDKNVYKQTCHKFLRKLYFKPI